MGSPAHSHGRGGRPWGAHGAQAAARAAAATAVYCSCSMAMMYANKYVLSVHGFAYPSAVLAYQCAIAVVLLRVLHRLNVVKVDPIEGPRMRKWMPATILFLVMVYSGSQCLAYLSIPIVTVFKNLTNILVAYGDKYLFGQPMSRGVLASLVCMLVGSLLSCSTDLQFSAAGYAWLSLNCVATGGYALYLKKARRLTGLSEFGMAYYNNVLTGVLLVPVALLSGEGRQALDFPELGRWSFQVMLALSGVVGAFVGVSAFWLVGVTSPTTYSIIGSLNKIPLTVISTFVFDVPMSTAGVLSISFGLASGMLYSVAKVNEQRALAAARPKIDV
eukprot:Opistho-1_new@54226